MGYLCQLNDVARLYSGAFFAAAVAVYLAAVHPWYAYPFKSLFFTYVAATGAALYGMSESDNTVSLAILAVWTVLHFGPKESSDTAKEIAELPKDKKAERLKKSYLNAAAWTLGGIVLGGFVVSLLEQSLSQ